METTFNLRRLRILYMVNVFGAGLSGLLITAAPEWAATNMFWPGQDPAIFSIVGSIWLAIGLASLLGLAQPLRMVAVFAVQLIYKTIWLTTFVLPIVIGGTFRPEGWILVGIFLVLIIGFVICVPFDLFFSRKQATLPASDSSL
jgi:hypothetical protein